MPLGQRVSVIQYFCYTLHYYRYAWFAFLQHTKSNQSALLLSAQFLGGHQCDSQVRRNLEFGKHVSSFQRFLSPINLIEKSERENSRVYFKIKLLLPKKLKTIELLENCWMKNKMYSKHLNPYRTSDSYLPEQLNYLAHFLVSFL